MAIKLLSKIFGSRNERLVKQFFKQVEKINALEPSLSELSDDELAGKTQEFKERLLQGETLENLLCEAFAVVREAGKRVLNMRHFDVQLIGGMVLHQGEISEMRTGEGKTLVATLAAYLNALSGKGVHVITVNDYLARRDSEWMGKIYNFLAYFFNGFKPDCSISKVLVVFFRVDLQVPAHNRCSIFSPATSRLSRKRLVFSDSGVLSFIQQKKVMR